MSVKQLYINISAHVLILASFTPQQVMCNVHYLVSHIASHVVSHFDFNLVKVYSDQNDFGIIMLSVFEVKSTKK